MLGRVVCIVTTCLLICVMVFVKTASSDGCQYLGPHLEDDDSPTCKEFSQYARFNPYSVLDDIWVIFYYFAQQMDRKGYHFYVPSSRRKKLIKKLLNDSVTTFPVNWTQPTFVMKEVERNMSSLIVQMGDRGQFISYPIVKKVKPGSFIRPQDIYFKQTDGGKYLTFMICSISDIEDYDQTYRIPRVIFKFVGIRMLRENTRRTRISCFLLYGFELFLMVTGMLQEITHMVRAARGGSFQDTADILRTMPCLGYIILGVSKSYRMVADRLVYENLFRELRDMWPRGLVSQDEHHVLRASLKELNFVIRSSYVCNYMVWFLFMLPPYVAYARRAAGRAAAKTLPFYLWFPFDPLQPIVYEVLLAMLTWSGLVTLLLLVVADMMYCISLSHLACLLRLLALRIQRLVHVPVDDQLPETYPLGKASVRHEGNDESAVSVFRTPDFESRHVRELEEIIKRHHALIRLMGDVERLNGFQLLLNFVNSSIIICACSFCSVVVEQLTELKYKSFLVSALVQTWLLCWFGQKIIDSSVEVAEALYSSGWYNASKRLRSTMIIMICRSQKELHITTYGFSVVNLASYTTIVKTAWSYFTLLLKLYED